MSSLRANLFLVALGLSMLGLVMVYSATYGEAGTEYLFERTGHMVLGVAAFFVASRIRYRSGAYLRHDVYLTRLATKKVATPSAVWPMRTNRKSVPTSLYVAE